jgi:hypothetical protein
LPLAELTRGALASPTLSFCLAFAASLWTLIMAAATRFRQDTSILNFTVELFQHSFKRITGD